MRKASEWIFGTMVIPGTRCGQPLETALRPGETRTGEALARARRGSGRRCASRPCRLTARNSSSVTGANSAADDRPAVLDQGDRDRPVGMAGEEGARAVDRIDDPHAARREARRRHRLSSDSQP